MATAAPFYSSTLVARAHNNQRDGRNLATKTVSCRMQCFRSINGVAAFERINFRTCERAVVWPCRDLDHP